MIVNQRLDWPTVSGRATDSEAGGSEFHHRCIELCCVLARPTTG